MTVERNFKRFFESISSELQATQNRIRDLIGSAHWGTEGSYKEIILREIIKRHLPEVFHVGTGFASGTASTSHQTDILITDKKHPTYFKQHDLRVVPCEAVCCTVEVKTRVNGRSEFEKICEKACDDIEAIRRENLLNRPKTGIFVFNYSGEIDDETILHTIGNSTRGDENRVINYVCFGDKKFIRFWERGNSVNSPVNGSVWHMYEIENLAPAYLITNIIVDLAWSETFTYAEQWFPLEAGKERNRTLYLGWDANEAKEF
ncbi:MAG: hypothetical protein KQI62_07655 [Deltaproteobacteria bacterium]|nr:hypothetical protein [Deltaproteobacteria bacterium]